MAQIASSRRAELLKLTWSELVSMAQKMGLGVPTDATKRNIVAAIIEAEAPIT